MTLFHIIFCINYHFKNKKEYGAVSPIYGKQNGQTNILVECILYIIIKQADISTIWKETEWA